MKRVIYCFLILIVLLQCYISVVLAAEIDAITVVSRVVDGDTFETTSEGRIRLADVDAPEPGESGYYDAKQCLEDLIDNKTVVLDIDDIYQNDSYGRLVCVVYVRHNSTHYVNVNKALLVEEVVIIEDYDNEFDPYTWTLYIHENTIPEYTSLLVLPLFIIATLLTTIVYKRKVLDNQYNGHIFLI
jgi:hypothetical protein